MKRKALPRLSTFLCLLLALTSIATAQLPTGPGIADSNNTQPVSSRTFSFSASLPGQLDGALTITFAIYPDQQSSSALWTETQVVQVASEKYSVMLGSTSATGLPQDIFAADQAHWLGVQVNGVEKRFLLRALCHESCGSRAVGRSAAVRFRYRGPVAIPFAEFCQSARRFAARCWETRRSSAPGGPGRNDTSACNRFY